VEDSIHSSSTQTNCAHTALRLHIHNSNTYENHGTHFWYPSFNKAPPRLSFDDHYAFRRTGSTTAALIQLLNTIANMLATNKYVVVLFLNFSNAFDTVRYSSLTEKLAQFDLSDNGYNWLAEYFNGHFHCTQFSYLLHITASITQGSATITYKALCTNSPQDLASHIRYHQSVRSLHSSAQHFLVPTPSNTNFGSHSFLSATPVIWNSIPLEISSSPTIDTFKRSLKTHYFCFPPA